MRERIVLAYSGDLRTSVAIPWLVQHRADVVTVSLDVGQRGGLEQVRERALAAGATRAHVLDLREEFARGYILPALQAGVLCRDGCPMSSALARPLIAKSLVKIAGIENARVVAHGSATASSDGPSFEALVHSLDPDLRVVAPVREWGMTEDEAVEYARRRRVSIPGSGHDDGNTNLWGRTIRARGQSGEADQGFENHYVLTTPRSRTPDLPAVVELAFERGVPISINGVPMPLTELIESLTLIAGQHGVGRLEGINTAGGQSRRQLAEAPAAHVLHVAHETLEASVLPLDLIRVQRALSLTYADLVGSGRWFTPLREALDAFHANAQSRVTGVSEMQLFKGQVLVLEQEAVIQA